MVVLFMLVGMIYEVLRVYFEIYYCAVYSELLSCIHLVGQIVLKTISLQNIVRM